jgi:serine/threonine-protein kinase RsbW
MPLIFENSRANVDPVAGAGTSFSCSQELNKVVPANLEVIEELTTAVSELLTSRLWPGTDVMKVELAAREALTNAIRHGCRNVPEGRVRFRMVFDASGAVVIIVRDSGPGFDPTKIPNPLEGGNRFRGSGRGVFLINQLMDAVEFTDGGRQVLMRKRPAM